jgi:hypothetical protein
MNHLVTINSPTLPALVTAAGERASTRFLEFSAANIRNPAGLLPGGPRNSWLGARASDAPIRSLPGVRPKGSRGWKGCLSINSISLTAAMRRAP